MMPRRPVRFSLPGMCARASDKGGPTPNFVSALRGQAEALPTAYVSELDDRTTPGLVARREERRSKIDRDRDCSGASNRNALPEANQMAGFPAGSHEAIGLITCTRQRRTP